MTFSFLNRVQHRAWPAAAPRRRRASCAAPPCPNSHAAWEESHGGEGIRAPRGTGGDAGRGGAPWRKKEETGRGVEGRGRKTGDGRGREMEDVEGGDRQETERNQI